MAAVQIACIGARYYIYFGVPVLIKSLQTPESIGLTLIERREIFGDKFYAVDYNHYNIVLIMQI